MSRLAAARRFVDTVRHLRREQLIGRIWFRLARPRVEDRPAPRRRAGQGAWISPAARLASLIAPTRFSFLNQDGDVSRIGWDDPSHAKLWRYNQHYFDDLNAQGAAARQGWHRALIDDWIERVPPAQGTAWEPYPLSLRIVNLIKWFLGGVEPDARLLHSLATQVRFLSKRLEYHLLGNHLFANAKALLFAGLFFEGAEADGWRKTACAILHRETGEQILGDGGQFERSPMYHALALEDLLDLVNLANVYRPHLSGEEDRLIDLFRARVPAMRHWLAVMSHPDGDLAFFNDTAFHIAPHRDELEAYAERLGLPSGGAVGALNWLRDSGYARLEAADAVLICDMAAIGPDYLPGHAHADTLSFELSVHGQRIFVNSGTSTYAPGAERLRQRGTAAHNCVVVAGRDSSEVWSSFRVGARARPWGATVEQAGALLHARCGHDGYRRLAGSPRHMREWSLQPGRLRIEDRIEGGRHGAVARFHLHPDIRVDQDSARQGRLTLADGRILRWTSAMDAAIEASTWHPAFGVSQDNACLVVSLADSRAELELEWA